MAATMALAAGPVSAQVYPDKPVKLIVPQGAGGATDVFARYMATKLGAIWGQPVVVDNRAGAAGVVGTEVVAKSPADGYTLLLTYAGSQAVNQSIYSKLPFNSVKDFTTVATVATTPFFLVVGVNSPIKDFRDLIARAKAKPGSMTYSTSGNGSINHLLSESLKVEAGIDMVHVPYKAIAAALTDVMSGNVDNAFAAVPSAIQLIRGGKLRAGRSVEREAQQRTARGAEHRGDGLCRSSTSARGGAFSRRPACRTDREQGQRRRGGDPEDTGGQAFFREQGAEPLMMKPEAFQKTLESDVVKWAKVVKASGAKLD